MSKKIAVKVEAAATIPLDELVNFQQDIKTISKVDYENLRQGTISEGITLCLHIWKQGKKKNLIDGHQRVWTWKKMRDEEGFEFEDIPVSIVKAKTLDEAKRIVLLALSQSGKIKPDAFAKYIQENRIPVEWLVAHVSPPGINMGDFAEKFLNIKAPTLPTLPESDPATKMASSSGQVKQIQLYFNAQDMEEFNRMINELSGAYQTENITDTVLEAVRAAHQDQFRA